jgi:hypothetical protein
VFTNRDEVTDTTKKERAKEHFHYRHLLRLPMDEERVHIHGGRRDVRLYSGQSADGFLKSLVDTELMRSTAPVTGKGSIALDALFFVFLSAQYLP